MACWVHQRVTFGEEPVGAQPGGGLSPGYALAARNAPISDTSRRCWASSGARLACGRVHGCTPDADAVRCARRQMLFGGRRAYALCHQQVRRDT